MGLVSALKGQHILEREVSTTCGSGWVVARIEVDKR